MKRRLVGATIAAMLGLPFCLWAVSTSTPAKGPHPFMGEESKCDLCHLVTWKGTEGTLEEDRFSRSLIGVCNGCHKERIGRSHPVGMDPYAKIPRDKFPAGLPLQWSDDLMADVMTCVTCHDMHAERFSEKKMYTRQKPHPEGGGKFLTYHLRIRGDSTRQGYAPLCKSCHPSY